MRKPTLTPDDLARAVRNVPDFPQPGIQFKDITPVLADAELFAGAIDLLTSNVVPGSVDIVVGIDARGFIFASAAALNDSGSARFPITGRAPRPVTRRAFSLSRTSAVTLWPPRTRASRTAAPMYPVAPVRRIRMKG